MKILFFVNHSDPYGSNRAMLLLIEELINRKHIVHLVLGANGGICDNLELMHVPYTVIPHRFSIYPPKPFGILQYPGYVSHIFLGALRNIIAFFLSIYVTSKIKPDIIHTNIGPDKLGFRTAHLLNIPHIWHLREYQDFDFNWQPFPSKNCFERSLNQSHVICITKDIFQHFQQQNNPDALVIYDAVGCKRPRVALRRVENYILFASRLEIEKGIWDAINIFESLHPRFPHFKLKIIGSGSQHQAVQAYINSQSAAQRIELLGFVPNPQDYMQSATALLVTSHNEGFGLITAEAFLCGCPVVGYNHAGTKEILSMGDVGYPFLHKNECLAILEALLAKPESEPSSKTLRAYELAQSLFTIEGYTDKILKAYRRAIIT